MRLFYALPAKDRLFWRAGDVIDFICKIFGYRIDWMCRINDWFIEGWFKRIGIIDLKKSLRKCGKTTSYHQ